jgi:hypothetical protein
MRWLPGSQCIKFEQKIAETRLITGNSLHIGMNIAILLSYEEGKQGEC